MPFPLLIIISGGILLAGLVYFAVVVRPRRRREQLRRQPLRPEFVTILEHNVPLYRKMPEALHAELRGYVNVFLHDKEFVGCAGLEVTDEMRVTVAGNACLLLLNRKENYFRGFSNILMYPDTYIAQEAHWDGAVMVYRDSARAGESWERGPIVLSWNDVRKGYEHTEDGHNVVLHEFAHKLDEENGVVDGLPILREREDYAEWARVLSKEFSGLIQRAQRRKNRVLDSYGTSAPSEFFAVATESFFERGALMKQRLPDLYDQLRKFYGVDPADWV